VVQLDVNTAFSTRRDARCRQRHPLLAVWTDRPWTIKRALRLDPGPSSDTDRRAHRQGAQGRTRGRRPEVLEVLDHCTLAPPPFRVLQCFQCLRSTAPVHVHRGGRPSCYGAALLRAASGLVVASSGQDSRWGFGWKPIIRAAPNQAKHEHPPGRNRREWLTRRCSQWQAAM
jgi:hypothetical protein